MDIGARQQHFDLLRKLHGEVVAANHKVRRMYRANLRPALLNRGGETTQAIRLRAQCHQQLSVFVRFEGALRNYLQVFRCTPCKAHDRAAQVRRYMEQVVRLYREKAALDEYARIAFPLFDTVLAASLGLNASERQQLQDVGMDNVPLFGVQIAAALARAVVLEREASAAKLQKLAACLAKELSPETLALLEWAGSRPVHVSHLVRFIKTSQVAAG